MFYLCHRMKKGLIAILLLLSVRSYGQGSSIKDSSIFLTTLRFTYTAYEPGGDLVERFGWASGVGLHADVKFRSQWLVGIGGKFLFGKQVKENVIADLQNADGVITDISGNPSIVIMSQRGFTIEPYVGRLIPVWGPNPNSGFLVTAGMGFLQHKIKIEHRENPIPQLEGDYLKGYDRLTNGVLLHEFIGYQYLSNGKLWNFTFGIDLMQGFTKNQRAYDFSTMQRDDRKRTDLYFGLRAGWLLPLYAKPPREFYY